MSEDLEEKRDDQPRRIKVRIESLSDLVFGLALSIGSLEFLSSPARDPLGLATNLVFFGFSFFILVFTWLGYSRTMAVLPRETETSLYLNLLLLFLTAIEPYLFYVLVTSPPTPPDADVASVFYALDVGGLFLVQAALSRLVILEDLQSKILKQEIIDPEIIGRFRRVTFAEIVIGLFFIVSTLPIFWEIKTPIGQARFIFWWSSFAVFFIIRSKARTKVKRKEEVDLSDSVK
jgi:uncharacterized membrane protein